MDTPGFTTFVDIAPGRRVENKELGFANIQKRTGIETRNIADRRDTIESLAITAVRKLFTTLNIRGKDCSGLILTSSFPRDTDDMAARVAASVGVQGWVEGVNFACSGFPRSVFLALERFRENDRHIVVVAAEILSRMVNWADEKTAILFGDRAAATSIEVNGIHPILDARAKVFEDKSNLIELREVEGLDREGQWCRRPCLQMNGLEVFKVAPGIMLEEVDRSLQLLDGKGIDPCDLSTIVPHQANGRILDLMEKQLASAQGQWGTGPLTLRNEIDHMGNIASSSIPSALAHVQKTLPVGTLVSCPSMGGGPRVERGKLTRGNVVFRVGEKWEE